MNIEEAIKIVKKIRQDYNLYYPMDRKEVEAVETLLTAYEKEKEASHYIQSQLDIANAKLVEEKEKNKDMSCDLTETRADNIDESTMLKQIKLKLQEKNIPIETLLAEFERLEDLEDDLTTVYLNGVYDGEKKVEDKIKAKIEVMNTNIVNAEKFDCDYIGQCRFAKYVLESLLEKE